VTTLIDELNATLATKSIGFHSGAGGLPCARIATKHGTGELYLHGAHVTAFQPTGQAPVLWMSNASSFENNKPIRGGVPICFPWFGPNPNDGTLPAHGWARTKAWEIVSVGQTRDSSVKLELSTTIAPFQLRFSVTFGTILEMTLQVILPEDERQSASFEEALHTYLTVGDVRQIEIEGLEDIKYLDKVGGAAERAGARKPIQISGETDRVYRNTRGACTLTDPVLKRRIKVSKWGSASTVIWNPWIDKSKRMPDFGDEEWPGMVCIESANIHPSHIELAPGQIHTLRVEIEATTLGF
jgi:glucose-6-phosphate 1-epimerase